MGGEQGIWPAEQPNEHGTGIASSHDEITNVAAAIEASAVHRSHARHVQGTEQPVYGLARVHQANDGAATRPQPVPSSQPS